MKKGFALLETIVVITFLSVSMLMLYNTFRGMNENSKNNLLYDDASNIYKTYFLKEYLKIDDLKYLNIKDINEITCDNINISSCSNIIKKMNINKMYIVKYDLKDFHNEFMSNLNNYLSSLSNKDNYKYRFVVEFIEDDNYHYSSLGFGDDYE